MNKEEKEAIDILEKFKTKGYSILLMQYGDRNKTNLKIEMAIETVLNLIFKQQKEIEELKKYYEQKLEDYYEQKLEDYYNEV